MSATESIVGVLGGGVAGVLAVQARTAFLGWLDDRRAGTAQAVQARGVEAREETARHRLAEAAVAREDRREAQLHDECREEVRKLGERMDKKEDEYREVREDLVRCEERHTASERREAERDERLSRLEAKSNPPPAMEPA